MSDYGLGGRLIARRQENAVISTLSADRRGRGTVAILGGLAVLALIFWILTRSDGEGAASEAISPEIALRGPSEVVERNNGASEITPRPRTEEPPPGEPRRGAQPSFKGRGSVRGLVTAAKGSKLPESFTLNVGPSDSLFGREFAESRVTELTAPEFEISDLPMGGYDVWVKASGMNSRRYPVLLSQSASSPYLVLRVSPTGFIDGFVMNKDGRPAQDLQVTLQAMFGDERLETLTRGDGFYTITDVPDGEYKISFGPLNEPLVPARELIFQAPSMRFPKIELPPTVDILIHTTDREGHATGDVTINGFGRPSGQLEVVTDFGGLGWVRNLPPGRYRVAARNGDGLKARITLEVKDQMGQEFWIAIR
jgi:hypothetical protein